jgi:hypothetical protein
MKRALLAMVIGAVAVVLCWPLPTAAQKDKVSPDKTRVKKIMQEKLKTSQGLLEGVALSDFDKISRSAEDLIQLSKTAEWYVYQTPRYEMHSNEFRRAAEGIIQKAKAKNIDGVTLAYFEMTMSCVRCHDYVRDVRDVGLPARPVLEDR